MSNVNEKGVHNVNHGKFLILEGVDGSGLSTQAQMLRAWLEENQTTYGKTHFTKEPTDGPIGSVIRQALSKRLKPLDEKVMALLFAADRLDHLYCSSDGDQMSGINELLEQGINVISDRYYLSSYAYQSLTLDLSWIREINRFARKPDLIVFIHVPVQESVRRRNNSRFHEELYEKENYLTKIRHNYLEICTKLQAEGENVVVIDGARDKVDVFTEIKQAFIQLYK